MTSLQGAAMPQRGRASAWTRAALAIGIAVAAGIAGCGGGGGDNGGGGSDGGLNTVRIVDAGANVVSTWSDVAATTINLPAAAAGTPAEQRPIDSLDLATVHIAIYDALMSITGTHQPFLVANVSGGAGSDASQPAAVSAAAFGVLSALYPARAAQYRPTYDSLVGGIADNPAKAEGLRIGAEVAAGVVVARANDGRSVALAPYVSGTAPGRFRGVNPINRFLPSIRPLALQSLSQFRPPAPYALDTVDYARDVAETQGLGGAVNSLRTEAQLEIARFHTEPPFRFWPRNLQRFARTDRSLSEHARLMAMLYVSQADATMACFEAKYFYEFWRPTSAITLADTDGNALTQRDATWTPVVPTPNHPEYPAAHACNAAAIAAVLRTFYGTDNVAYVFDSTVTNTTHRFETTQGLVDEIRGARIYGGMHFRNALVRGEALGEQVAQWVAATRFRKN